MRRNKLLLLLVLLMTAATGAWANWTGGTYTATTNEFLGSITVSDNATLTINQNVTVKTGAITINEGKTLTILGPGSLVVRGTDGSDGQDGGVGINGSGCIVVKGNANVRVDGGEGGDKEGETGGNGGTAITCSVTIYSGTLTLYGGEGGDGQNSGNGGDCFAGSGTFTYYGGNVTANGGTMGDAEFLGQSGDFGKVFASTYNVVFENQPTSLTDGYSDPITVDNIKSANDVIIEGDGADPVPVYYAVKMKDATQAEAANWTIASGSKSVKGSVADGLTGVEEGDAVTLTYSGRLKVKGVKATSDAGAAGPKAAKDVTASDIGKVIGADGNIYDDAAAATAANTTAVALICYVGDAGSADASSDTYKGLALALTDASTSAEYCSQEATCLEPRYDASTKTNDMAGIASTDALVGHATHTHAAASAARSYNSGTHPTGTSEWFLPSAGQWQKMIDAAGGYATLKANASLQEYYWTSTDCNMYFAWYYNFDSGSWDVSEKNNYNYVRAAIAF